MPDQTANRLLAALPPDERQRLMQDLEHVDLVFRDTLFASNEPIRDVYFIESGVGSVVADQDGSRVEIATVGNEGLIGLPVFLGSDSVPLTAFVQIPGTAFRMPSAAFRSAIDRGGSQLRSVLHRYTEGLLFQIAQSAACRSLHNVEQRAARWLLMTRDRVFGPEFPLTQEFLGQMLGVRRATVTEVQSRLRDAGLVEYRRGWISILDEDGLEARSCACYAIITDEYRRQLGEPIPPSEREASA